MNLMLILNYCRSEEEQKPRTWTPVNCLSVVIYGHVMIWTAVGVVDNKLSVRLLLIYELHLSLYELFSIFLYYIYLCMNFFLFFYFLDVLNCIMLYCFQGFLSYAWPAWPSLTDRENWHSLTLAHGQGKLGRLVLFENWDALFCLNHLVTVTKTIKVRLFPVGIANLPFTIHRRNRAAKYNG
jgi:hypothetical protein